VSVDRCPVCGNVDRNRICHPTPDPRPLSAEEEADLRRGIVSSLRDGYHYHPLTVAMCLATLDAERARHAALVKAAQLRRNVLIHDEIGFDGEWIAVPREDFLALRAALIEEARNG
jgi:hypothetical protein